MLVISPRRSPGLLACALSLALLAAPALAQAPKKPAEPPASVEFTRDVVYGKAGDVELKLDISVPREAAGPLPCVVVIHGGGWAAGNKSAHADITWKLAERGYVSASIGYRFAPAHPWPAQVHDVKCAVRYLRAHAEKYRLDKDRIGAVGFSAGGHLSLMLGVTGPEDGLEGDGGWPGESSRVQAVVNFFGPTQLDADDIPGITLPILQKFLGGTLKEKPEQYKKASPITYVTSDDAPILTYQGTTDVLVPPTQATRLAEAMTKAKVKGRVELLVGLGHGWGGAELERTGAGTFAFFDEHLMRAKSAGTASKEPGK